jgi:hypothetical protein
VQEEKTLRPGRVFEMELLGRTEEADFVDFQDRPEVLRFRSSMQVVIDQTQELLESRKQQGFDYYDPSNPKAGKTEQIFSAVKKHLPRRVSGHSASKLELYVSVGRTSLDWYHGVDFFFVWEGVSVTVDVSLGYKNPREMRAEFLFNPSDLEADRLDLFARNIADRLKKRRVSQREKKRKNNKNRIHMVETPD